MPIEGEYEPGTWDMAARQVERYEASGGTEGTTAGGPAVSSAEAADQQPMLISSTCV